MNNENIILENLLNAPVEAVWSALTDNDEIKQWYFQLEEFRPEPGFKFSFSAGPEDGEKFLHLCEIKEVIPEKKIAYTWRYNGYPGDSLIKWELESQGDKTKLTVTHSGVETMAANGPDFSKESFTSGWTYFVKEALPKYFEK